MPILSIKHVTTYRYRQPVALGEHRMMLLPRDDDDQKVLQSELEIRPKPRELAWARDKLGNHVAIAHFADRSDELCVVSTICLEHAPNGFYGADIKDYARIYPFSFAEDWSRLRRFILPLSLEPELRRWSEQFFRNGSADTHALLVDMTRTIRRTLGHVARREKGIQDPIRTIALGSGSCRDLAVLMIAALRSRGIAARFVSGYLHLTQEEHQGDEHPITGGNTHAWVQAYVPGPGWVDFDPSAGVVGNQNLIRVAVVEDPRDAIPLQGTWYGSASDHLAMEVAVRVKAALNDRAFMRSCY